MEWGKARDLGSFESQWVWVGAIGWGRVGGGGAAGGKGGSTLRLAWAESAGYPSWRRAGRC